MEAREGVLFLRQLLQDSRYTMTADDLEEAIRLAGQYSPSAAIDRAGRHYRTAHVGVGEMEILAFAKGVRWLAVLRRDEGERAFETAAATLLVGTLYPEAAAFAAKAHAGQTRQGGESYISHVYRVAAAAHRQSRDETTTVAALLHDVVEDCGVSVEAIAARFGPEVAQIVAALSHEYEEEPEAVYLDRVKSGGPKALLIKRVDKLDNIRSLSEAPKAFRRQKLAEIRQEFLPIWRQLDPEGATAIERLVSEVSRG